MRSQNIKEYAHDLGFDDCGITLAESLKAEEDYFATWLQNNYYAGMEYMVKNREKRHNPRRLMEDAKSVICLLSNYKPVEWQQSEYPQIASFAYGMDYHLVLKERLFRLNELIIKEINRYLHIRPFVDTAPIFERAWAARAGLGWIGKSTLLVSPRFGPFTFISILLTNLELEYDPPIAAQCGSCTNCLQACPTGALRTPYTIDAQLCISYHTIENKAPCGVNPEPYIFGCDSCVRACPWGASTPATSLFPPLQNTLQITKAEWQTLSLDEFNSRFSGSPLQRAGLSKLQNTLNLWNGKLK